LTLAWHTFLQPDAGAHPVISPMCGMRAVAVAAAVAAAVAGCWLAAACGTDASSGADGPLVVYNAASITRPMRAVLDSFAARTHTRYVQESASSLELVRRLTELQSTPDVLALADPDLFPTLLEPRFTTWHALFGRNRMVLAYTPRSRFASEIGATNWWEILARPGVQVGRSDPNTDPSGYRTLLVWQLAGLHYGVPDMEARMLRAAPPRNIRPREADQVALLQAGELDYIWTYENLAALMGLPYLKLPDAVDLGAPADSASYARASTRVLGKRAGDTITVRGRPILFGVTVPRGAPHPGAGERFVAYLLSDEGRRILRRTHFDALDAPALVGHSVPALVASPTGTLRTP
jgi:molybdate/tungstate transport system substrate-binding protein